MALKNISRNKTRYFHSHGIAACDCKENRRHDIPAQSVSLSETKTAAASIRDHGTTVYSSELSALGIFCDCAQETKANLLHKKA